MRNKALARASFAAIFMITAACAPHSSPVAEPTDDEQAWLASEGTGTAPTDLSGFQDPELSPNQKTQLLASYAHLDPNHVVPTALLSKAVTYFDANKSKFANQSYLSVIDFSKSSKKARFFIVNLKTGAVWALHNAHGKGSDANHDGLAESFGNASGSGKSSLGYYRTAETYPGQHGLSLRLDGLSSTNSKARSRAIVVHAATYVSEATRIQGRSLGCPAITPAYRDQVIAQIKNGSLIYAGLSGQP